MSLRQARQIYVSLARAAVQALAQLLAGLEERHELLPDRHCRARPRIAARARGAVLDRKSPETTELDPVALDAWLHALEDAQGRRRDVPRFSSRTLDIDLVLYGDVVLRGLRLCEPCAHLEKLTVKGVARGLFHRGGLRAQVIKGGVLRKGDAIRPLDS